MPAPRCTIAVIMTMALMATACDSPPPDEEPAPLAPRWTEMTLPAPAGAPAPARLIPRELTACAGRWYIVGAVADAAGATQPAAWVSTDLQAWTAIPFAASSYYGRLNVVYTAGCRDGRLAALGGKVGGAHGNPRVSSWYQRDDGSMAEVRARFELYGGPVAVNVTRMTAGHLGWMITGNRYSGAAVWVSPDSAKFEIVEDAPELSSDERGETWAFDVIDRPEGWLVAGAHLKRGRIDRDVMGWTSTDGTTWRRLEAADATDEYEEIQRVAAGERGTFGVGLRGGRFGAWRLDGETWRPVGRFGDGVARGVPAVRSLTAVGDHLLAATSDGAEHHLWISGDSGVTWSTVTGPVPAPAGAEQTVAVLAAEGRVVLLTDDGKAGRAWWTGIPIGPG
jgi:hypothetical protein